MKIVLKWVVGLVGLFSVLLMVFVAVNWQDDVMRSDVELAFDWQIPENALQNNGYLILMGMNSPLDQDARAAGAQVLLDEHARYMVLRQSFEEPEAKQTDLKLYMDWSNLRCDHEKEPNCLDFYLKQGDTALISLLTSQERLIERYQSIQNSPQYIELVAPMVTASIPDYGLLMQANELIRAKVVLSVHQSRLDEALLALETNARFSRRLLDSSVSLISHMVALNMLQRDARLVSELLIRYPNLAQEHYSTIETVLASIPMADYNMKKAFEYERAMQVGVVYTLKKKLAEVKQQATPSWLQRWAEVLYLPNATAHLFYDMGSLPIWQADASPVMLDQLAATLKDKRNSLLGFGYSPYYVRNPVGKILASIATPDYQAYIERHHDVDGYLTLVRLQLAMAASDTLKNKPALSQYINPYTQRPMDYDMESGMIRFEAKQPSSSSYQKNRQYQISVAAYSDG